MKTLEKGKLYQVYYDRDWIIAEYVSRQDAHTAHGYRSTDGAESWHEPAMHYWKTVAVGYTFRMPDKGMQIRPVAEGTLSEITRLRSEIADLGKERAERFKALKELAS